MQNKPKYLKAYYPNKLSEDYPFMTSELFYQTDREIIELHVHNVLEMGYCFEGSGIFIVEDKIMQYNTDDMIFITSNEYHLAQSVTGTISKWKWVNVDINKFLLPFSSSHGLTDISSFQGNQFKNVIQASEYPELCTTLKNMILENEGRKLFYKENIRGLFISLLTQMHRLFSKKPVSNHLPQNHIQRLHNAIIYISNNFMKQIEVNSLAKRCHMSATHFRRLFKQTLGKTPQDYLNEVRITMACAQLKNRNQPITQIAFECGFTTLSSFNRQFKKQLGIAPRDWLKQQSSY